MSFFDRFSEAEQVALAALPSLSGSAMVMAEGSGLGTIKEVIASTKALKEEAKFLSNNEIVQAILPVYDKSAETDTHSERLRNGVRMFFKNLSVKNKKQMKDAALDEARRVNALLFSKASPLEQDQYKSWLLHIAEQTAKAAKEGGFLGFGGERVSEGEKNFFMELAGALHPVRTDANLGNDFS